MVGLGVLQQVYVVSKRFYQTQFIWRPKFIDAVFDKVPESRTLWHDKQDETKRQSR